MRIMANNEQVLKLNLLKTTINMCSIIYDYEDNDCIKTTKRINGRCSTN